MNRVSDEQALLLVPACGAYLEEKFVYTRGLFYTTPSSQTAVRALAQRMTQRNTGTVRDEQDPHIIAGTMLFALKSMRFPLLYEVQGLLVVPTGSTGGAAAQLDKADIGHRMGGSFGGDMANTAPSAGTRTHGGVEVDAEGVRPGIAITEDFPTVKHKVTHMLLHMSQNRLAVLQQLLGLAMKLSTLAGAAGSANTGRGLSHSYHREETLGKEGIINAFAPYLYRPYDTAHLSLRHKAHLVCVKPVLSFLLENFYDIFSASNNPSAAAMYQQACSQRQGQGRDGNGGVLGQGAGGAYSVGQHALQNKNDLSAGGQLRSVLAANSTEQSLFLALRALNTPQPPQASAESGPRTGKAEMRHLHGSGSEEKEDTLGNNLAVRPTRTASEDMQVVAPESPPSSPHEWSRSALSSSSAELSDGSQHRNKGTTHGGNDEHSTRGRRTQAGGILGQDESESRNSDFGPSGSGNGNNNIQNGWEWQVLQALLTHRVSSFVSGSSAADADAPTSLAFVAQNIAEQNRQSRSGGLRDRNAGSPDEAHVHRLSQLTIIDGKSSASGKADPSANAGSVGGAATRFSWGGGGAGVRAAESLLYQDSSSFEQVLSGNEHSQADAAGVFKKRRSNPSPTNASPVPITTLSSASMNLSNQSQSQSSSALSGRTSFAAAESSAPVISAARSSRRRAVSECRSLKQQISAFESSRANDPSHSTSSGSSRRRPKEVQLLYDRYKECKRNIRDTAAIDIQKVVRGAIARKKLWKFAQAVSGAAAKGDPSVGVGAITATGHAFRVPSQQLSGAGPASGSSMAISANTSGTQSGSTSGNNTDLSISASNLTNTAMSVSGMSGYSMANNSTSSLAMDAFKDRDGGTINVLSSLSFDAGLNVNQALNIKSTGAYGRNGNASTVSPRSGSAGSNSNSNNTMSISNPSSHGSSGGDDSDAVAHYRYLIAQKKDLKRLLKRFDEEFCATHGRQPKKADKEVLRPQYQRYHDLKGDMTRLRTVIEAEFGVDAVPSEEEVLTASTDDIVAAGDKPVWAAVSVSVPASATHHRSASSSPVNIASFGFPRAMDILPSAPAAVTATAAGASDSGVDANISTAQLHEEKRALHAQLKAYEKDFQAQHNRQVTRQDDIAPVAEEYRRYKEVKQLLAARGR